MNIKDLSGLKEWIMRYYDFLVAALQQMQQNNNDQAGAILNLLNQFDPNIANMTVDEILNSF